VPVSGQKRLNIRGIYHLASVYETGGELAQAHTAWAKASTIIQGLAEGIGDEALRARFLAGPQIQPVMQQAQSLDSLVSNLHTKPGER
jgi:hypothetical protein